jgi:hypothetical protein
LLLPLASLLLLLVLAAVEAQLGVLTGLQVWLAVQVRRPSLCADVHARKRHDQSGLDGLSLPWLDLVRLAWTGYPVATKLCVVNSKSAEIHVTQKCRNFF